jgi:tRNA nucleotidyltransferase (CCA-adding enzyme)
VRDTLRGVPPHDKDYVVAGLSGEKFAALFPEAVRAGRGFPVFRTPVNGRSCDVALARRETKTGPGYRGFSVSSGESVSVFDDLYRRDTTMNSMARDLLTDELIDPFGGARDIADRVVRATSEHFCDDPVRALRAARQSAQFGFSIDGRTIRLMGECRSELSSEPPERVVGELARALGSPRPSVFFRALMEARLLDVTYPSVFALTGTKGAFDRAMFVLDRVSEDTGMIEVRFAALVHDIGDPPAPGEKRGGDESGVSALRGWDAVMRLPSRWVACAEFAVAERARVFEISRPREIFDFLERLRRNPIGPGGMSAIVRALDCGEPDFLANSDKYYEAMDAVSGDGIPARLAGPARGKWLNGRKIEAVRRIIRETL